MDVLLEALENINTLNENVKLLIVGESYENKNKYLKLIKDFKLEDSVTWINEYVPDEKVNLYFSACDLVVLPYKKASQSGIIPIAYNYNKIVLASDINGLNEFIYEGKNGYLFDNLNPVYWDWKSNDGHDCGLVAQDVQKVIPEAVRGEGEGNLGLNYNYFIGLMMARMKEMSAEIDSLKKV